MRARLLLAMVQDQLYQLQAHQALHERVRAARVQQAVENHHVRLQRGKPPSASSAVLSSAALSSSSAASSSLRTGELPDIGMAAEDDPDFPADVDCNIGVLLRCCVAALLRCCVAAVLRCYGATVLRCCGAAVLRC